MNKIQIHDLGKIITGKTPRTSISQNYGGDIPFLTPSDNLSQKYIRSTKKTLTQIGVDSVKSSLLPPNSICVSCIGSDLGKVVIAPQYTVTNQQINSIVLNESLYDLNYIYYKMILVGRELNYISKTSTAVPIVNKSSFGAYQISIPSLEEQKRVGLILSALDDKIELNRKMNENLEQQAAALFKHWFIDFEFPNAKGKPYRSSGGKMKNSPLGLIPNEWKVGIISDIIDVRDGTHDSPKSQSTGYPLVTSKHLAPYEVKKELANLISEQDFRKINERSKVDTGDILLSMIGTVGVISLVTDASVDFAIKNVALFKTSKIKNILYYILFSLKSKIVNEYIEINLAGSTQKYVSLGVLRKIPIFTSPSSILYSFNNQIESILAHIVRNTHENRRLAELRDSVMTHIIKP